MSAPAAIAPVPRYYARVSRRLQAIVIDGAVYAVSPAVLLLLSSFTGRSTLAVQVVVVGWFLAVALYEPLLVTLRGATIGHAAANIRVVDARTGRPPAFWRALLRFVVKSVLGLLSFAMVVSTRRHQAAHDLAAGTTVEIRDLWRVRPGDYLEARVVDPAATPASLVRRGAVTAGSSLVWFAMILAVYLTSRSESCLLDEVCTRAEDVTALLLFAGWMWGQALLLALGLGGRLPGARPSLNGNPGAEAPGPRVR
jgi:uncharacterized RDD family membrane protein YckC